MRFTSLENSLYRHSIQLFLLFVFSWNISLAQAGTITISGSLTLPNSTSGIEFNINAWDSSNLETGDTDPISFGAGVTESFSLTVDDNPSSSWRVEAECTANCSEHMDWVIYSTSQAGNSSHDWDVRTELTGGSDHSNIDFNALEAVNISGTVTFPSGAPAPAGGMKLYVSAHDVNKPDGNWYLFIGNVLVDVTGSATSFTYDFKAVKDATASVIVDVYCAPDKNPGGECDHHMYPMFYALPDSSLDSDDAEELSGVTDHTTIDIDLIEPYYIKGTVSLPSGEVAPPGGVEFLVIADKHDTWEWAGNHSGLTIPEGAMSTSYSIRISPDLAWDLRVRAKCESSPNCDLYVLNTYYNDTIDSNSTPFRVQGTKLPNTQGYSGIDFSLFEKYSGPPITCNIMLDDFSGAAMDMDDWYDMETERVLDTVADKLELSQKLISDEERSTFRQRFSADLAESPPKNTLEAQVALTEADLTATGTGTAQAGVGGTFYSKLSSPVVDDQTGDIYAQVLIGNRGAGIEAWWEIYESLNPSFTSSSLYADGTLTPPGGGWLMSTEYTTKIVYDGSNGFTFTIGTSNDSGSGPARMAASPQEFRRLVASVFPENNTDTDPISVRATFDDVKTDGVSYDNFNGVSELDQSKWDETQAKRVLVGGKLRVESRTQSTSQVNVRTRLNFDTYGDAECLQATLNLQNSSGFPSDTRGRARVEGVWYNALHNATSGYNGSEGNVWGQLSLDRRGDGTVRADIFMSQADNAAWTVETELASFRFEDADPLALDTDYVATIMLDRPNKRMLYQFENEVIIVPILTKIYPVDPDEQYTALRTRVQDTASKLHVLFDDVKVSEADYDSDGIPNRTDTDDDGDGMSDTYEDDNELNPLDEEDADTDADNDGLTNKQEHDIGGILDPQNPDSDGDDVDDGRDMDPNVDNNDCLISSTTFNSVVTAPTMCGTSMPLTVMPPAEVQAPGGHLWIAAPSVKFDPEFKSGRVTVITGSTPGFPCAACGAP